MEKGAEVNETDDHNQTALYWAAAEGHKEIVKYLLSTKCDITIKSGNGRSALHFCAKRGDENLVNTLLDQGADPACLDNEGQSPLTLAALNNHKTTAMIILAKRANLEVTDEIESMLVTYFGCKNSDHLMKILTKGKVETCLHSEKNEELMECYQTCSDYVTDVGRNRLIRCLIVGATCETINNRERIHNVENKSALVRTPTWDLLNPDPLRPDP